MLVRRCAHVFVEPRESLGFDLARLLAGETGLVHERQWVALAAHLDVEVVLDEVHVALLGRLSADKWHSLDELRASHGVAPVDDLLARGLLISAEGADAFLRNCDEGVRASYGLPLSTVHHRHTRWSAIDTTEAERRFGRETDRPLLDHLGAPEPLVHERVAADARIALTRPADTPLEDLVRGRVTCRNYDRSRSLSSTDFAEVLYRTFAARGVSDQPGIRVMKRAVPSAGGLHPTEAYLLVQNVDGIAPGFYHYHPVEHALEPLRLLADTETAAIALRLVAGQRHFMDAHVVVILASRFGRTFWKYRRHAKSYRAVILDAGHLSQMLYLAATERGLAAFITAAVNECDIEQALGIDPLQEGVLAACGFGWRGDVVDEIEFDPLGAVWPLGTFDGQAADAAQPRHR